MAAQLRADADALHLVAGLVVAAQAGGVDHMQRHALDLDGLADLVARGAGDRRDDGQLGTGQGVEQASSCHVGLAGEHHLQTFAQQRALAGHGPSPACRLVSMPASWPTASAFSQEVDLLFGEIERGLHQHAAAARCARRSCIDLVRESTSEAAPAERAAASVLASIRSDTASAWARSSLSLRKARWVNSPGSARRKPGRRGWPMAGSGSAAAARQRASSSCNTTGPPWACSSSTSSPV